MSGMPGLRLLLIVPVVLALACGWYAGRWYFGNTITEHTPKDDEGAMERARTALRLAPDDPISHWNAGQIAMKEFTVEQLAAAVQYFEQAVSLSPNDYRLWMDLARAREQSGDPSGGEKALRRAVELAPLYAYPRWYLGNLLLRQGRRDEAFVELRRAGEGDKRLRPHIFNLAWRVYGEDIQTVERVVGDSAGARADLAVYLIGQGRIDEALQIWSSLNAAEKKQEQDKNDTLVKALLAAKRYRAVLDVSRDSASQGASGIPVVEQFFNGGFESDNGAAVAANIFGWQVDSSNEAQIAIDPRTGHLGSRSLRVVFNAPTNLRFHNISQLVAVESSTTYRFECYALARNLRTAGAPKIEVVDAADERVTLGASQPLAIESIDWQRVTIDFKTPEKAEAVKVRTSRAPCGPKMTVCPIMGLVWYDDFNLQRIGRGDGSGGDATGAGSAASAKDGSAR
jgi:tetratricopeptide (TPR) repeat protein